MSGNTTKNDITLIKSTCHCTGNTYEIRLPTQELPIGYDYCHCTSCRTVTGGLFVGYVEIPHSIFELDNPPSTLTSYRLSDKTICYFCSTCGAHIAVVQNNGSKWFVSTGLLDRVDGIVQVKWHQFLADTIDGGVSNILTDGLDRYATVFGGEKFSALPSAAATPAGTTLTGTGSRKITDTSQEDVCVAKCHCGNVNIRMYRPTARPLEISDVPMYAFCTDKNRWPANHCLCSDCRRTHGFAVWTNNFVPFTHLETSTSTPLSKYKSSSKVERFFCGTCGATVFYFHESRPKMYDVALGLVQLETAESSDSPRGLFNHLQEWNEFRKEIDFHDEIVDTWIRDTLAKGVPLQK